MPIVTVKKIIKINGNGGTVKVELKFKTLFLCNYEIDLREKGSNHSVFPFPRRGDNANPSDDQHPLLDPATSNDGRTIWAFLTIINQSGQSGKYMIDMEVTQDGQIIDTLTTGSTTLTGNYALETFIARFNI